MAFFFKKFYTLWKNILRTLSYIELNLFARDFKQLVL
jgi:hypothetical protein